MRAFSTVKIVSFSLCMLTLGCASKQEAKERVERQVSQEQVSTEKQLRTETRRTIESAPDLTEQERSQLLALRNETTAKAKALHQESLKLRAVLVKDLVRADYKPKDVAVLKKKIKKVEDQRLSLLMDAVEKTHKILGRKAFENQALMEDLIFRDGMERSGDVL